MYLSVQPPPTGKSDFGNGSKERAFLDCDARTEGTPEEYRARKNEEGGRPLDQRKERGRGEKIRAEVNAKEGNLKREDQSSIKSKLKILVVCNSVCSQ